MSKADRVYHSWVNEIRYSGWAVQKVDSVKFNSGSESAKHQHAKLATCRILKERGYRIDTEVVHDERGEIDVIAIPTQENQAPFAVEVETEPSDDVIASKVERYHTGTPFVEVYVVDLTDLSMDIIDMEIEIRKEIGL